MYFSATIFAFVGFDSPTLTSLSIAVTNCVFTFISFTIIDRVGRRRILLYSIPIMILGLILSSIAFRHLSFSDLHITSIFPASSSPDDLHSPPPAEDRWSDVIFAALVVYVAGYAIGLGNVPWQQSELFPLSIRSLGSGLATATNWSSNFLIGLTFLPLMHLLSPSGTFALYAVVCLVGWCALYYLYPETSGLSLEQVGALLKDDWGVKRKKGSVLGKATSRL